MEVMLSETLKKRRKDKNLKVKDVIEALEQYGIEIKEKTLYGWETGHRQPNADEFLALCCIYGIQSLSELDTTPQGDPAADVPPLDESEELDRQFSVLWESLDERGKMALAGILEIAARKSRVRVGGP